MPAKVNAAANWVCISSNNYASIWIDNNSIGRDSNGFFAYFRETYREAGRNEIIERRISDGLSVSGFYNLSHCVEFVYFKSSGRTKYFSIMGSVYYDKNGKVLDSNSTNYFDWQRVVPGTIGEDEYDAAYSRVWR